MANANKIAQGQVPAVTITDKGVMVLNSKAVEHFKVKERPFVTLVIDRHERTVTVVFHDTFAPHRLQMKTQVTGQATLGIKKKLIASKLPEPKETKRYEFKPEDLTLKVTI